MYNKYGNRLTVRMSDAEQKLDLISLFSSCFLLLPAPFKVVPVPGSAGLFKTHEQMTHLPQEVTKIKVRPRNGCGSTVWEIWT